MDFDVERLIIVVHVLLAVGIIGFILIQRGKGADAGASFGAGASQTVFGSQGSANFLSRTTAVLATGFFLTSFALAYVAKEKADGLSDLGLEESVVEQVSEDSVVPQVDVGTETAEESSVPAVE